MKKVVNSTLTTLHIIRRDCSQYFPRQKIMSFIADYSTCYDKFYRPLTVDAVTIMECLNTSYREIRIPKLEK